MKKIYLVLFVILSVFVFSCKDNLISDDLSSNQNSGAGQVKVFVKQSRLIGPDISEVTWTVELYKGNDKFSGKNENGYYLFSGLSDGTYNITVSGKIDEVEKFTGSAQVTIANGNSVSVNVPIVAKKTDKNAYGDGAEKKGYATITMDMSDKLLSLLNSISEYAIFYAQLYSVDGYDAEYKASFVKQNLDEQGEIVSIEFLDNQKVEFVDNIPSPTVTTENLIPTGYYYLTFSGLEQYGYTIKLKDNLVEIGDGLTTNIVLTQNDYELVEVLSESQIFYVDNSDNDHVYDTIDTTSITTYAGLSLSNPLGFRNIKNNISGTFYLITDVEAYKEDDDNSFSEIERGVNTITSFGSKIFSITNNNYDSFVTFNLTTLKNIKLTNTTGAGFKLNGCSIDGTVILDTPIAKNSDSVVNLDKSSKLVIGQNFSGELGICLSFEDWNIGDTVITFENGKPNNANFYISESYDSQGNSLASRFYIDDKGKLAQYDASTQWVNFAWNSREPCLITQTQAKNKTYTSIIDSTSSYLYGFNGISTYDGNRTWYFIANGSDASGTTVPSLYKVSAPTEYTDSVTPEMIEVNGISFGEVQAMAFDDGKLYFGYFLNRGYSFYSYDVSKEILTTIGWFSIHMTNANSFDLTSFMVKGNDFYIATTLTDPNQPVQVVTHSAIWQLKLEQTENGYILSPAQTYREDTGGINPVPYYLTQYDDKLTINNSFPKNSTFRITDLYSDGNSVYGLLANYEDKVTLQNAHSDIHMRGSVFKLTTNSSRQENSEPMMNANHFELRNSFPLTTSELPTAKHFILPRKIVGIVNKKLVIADDGMVPDSNDCNVDRFVFFDLASEISETIDVGTSFTTQASVSSNMFYTFDPLFDAPQY